LVKLSHMKYWRCYAGKVLWLSHHSVRRKFAQACKQHIRPSYELLHNAETIQCSHMLITASLSYNDNLSTPEGTDPL